MINPIPVVSMQSPCEWQREYNIEIKTGEYNTVFLARDKMSRKVCKCRSEQLRRQLLSATNCRLTLSVSCPLTPVG